MFLRNIKAIHVLNKIIQVLLILSTALLLLSCSNVRSSYDYDSATDFSRLKTYQWDNGPSSDFRSVNPLIAERIVKAINDNLKRKGLVEGEAADIQISYQVNFEKKLSTSNVSGGVGVSVGRYNRGSISISSGNQIREITEGTLMIDMVSNATNKLIWRSVTTKPVSNRNATPQDSEKRIGQLIYVVFENYPPKDSQ